ncbi:MAG TPA: hypothetical protein DEQ87_05745 [Algoriphagus sp.]|jgi:hypothetical protein|nr:hypothetical protein [Algoriphagus sp.]MAN85632.1 hypothetical protein [Algoriphagus sp.]HAD51740.1 hypothetical protein [Algoriphagus sp.]HCB46237.1 hypothetical protein [Algoriphagus sp.]HCD87130.1 hypothetical protein [Algoriphagus sp.]
MEIKGQRWGRVVVNLLPRVALGANKLRSFRAFDQSCLQGLFRRRPISIYFYCISFNKYLAEGISSLILKNIFRSIRLLQDISPKAYFYLFPQYFSKIPLAPFTKGNHPKLNLHFQRGD